MIENQSENSEKTDENVSEESNISESSSEIENKLKEDKHLPEIDDKKIYAEDLKNTITNNDARLEQLEKEHETLKSQYIRIYT